MLGTLALLLALQAPLGASPRRNAVLIESGFETVRICHPFGFDEQQCSSTIASSSVMTGGRGPVRLSGSVLQFHGATSGRLYTVSGSVNLIRISAVTIGGTVEYADIFWRMPLETSKTPSLTTVRSASSISVGVLAHIGKPDRLNASLSFMPSFVSSVTKSQAQIGMQNLDGELVSDQLYIGRLRFSLRNIQPTDRMIVSASIEKQWPQTFSHYTPSRVISHQPWHASLMTHVYLWSPSLRSHVGLVMQWSLASPSSILAPAHRMHMGITWIHN